MSKIFIVECRDPKSIWMLSPSEAEANVGIAPRDYKLFSCEAAEDGAWEGPDFLKPFEEQGEGMSLRDGETLSQLSTTQPIHYDRSHRNWSSETSPFRN